MEAKMPKSTDTIDFTAALPPEEAAQLRTRERTKHKRPRKATQAPRAAATAAQAPDSNILMVDNQSEGIGNNNELMTSNGAAPKPLTLQEIKFLELYLSGRHTIKSQMIKAGYKYHSDWGLYDRARKTLKRYERLAGDKADIFRDIGLGEVEVANNIKKLALNSKSEFVQTQATGLAAKCLRLTDAPPPSHQGVQIVINTIVQSVGEKQGPPDRETLINVTPGQAYDEDVKPLQITR
jgi:hypothetical protein